MADDPLITDSNEDNAGVPRWVYGVGIIALAVILLFVILHFSFGGPMGHGLR